MCNCKIVFSQTTFFCAKSLVHHWRSKKGLTDWARTTNQDLWRSQFVEIINSKNRVKQNKSHVVMQLS